MKDDYTILSKGLLFSLSMVTGSNSVSARHFLSRTVHIALLYQVTPLFRLLTTHTGQPTETGK